MKKIIPFSFIFAISFLFPATSMGQVSARITQMYEDMQQIRQKANSEALLRAYLSPVETQDSIVYAIIFRPASCPRCEADLSLFFDFLKNAAPTARTLIIACYENAAAAKRYIAENEYKSDFVLFDEEKKYNDIFSFSSGKLDLTYVLKLNKKQGRLIAGGYISDLSQQFADDFSKENSALPFHTYTHQAENGSTPPEKPADRSRYAYRSIGLETDSLHPVSSTCMGAVLEKGLFMYTDELANKSYLFLVNEKKATFKGEIVADSLEKRAFVSIPEELYQAQAQSHQLFYMPNGINFIGNRSIGVSYSLPDLSMEGEGRMSYYNKPVIICRDRKTLAKEQMIAFDAITHDGYMYMHFLFSPMSDPNYIILPCAKKTWPLSGETEEYKGKPELDPFMEEFYRQENPCLAIFDSRTGEVVKRFGQLDTLQQITRTGYYYSDPIVSTDHSKLLYADCIMGKFYLTSEATPEKTEKVIDLFRLDPKKLPQADSTLFYNYEYPRVFDNYFNKRVKEVQLTPRRIYCLVKHGMPYEANETDTYEYIEMDLNGKVIKQYQVVPESKKELIYHVGLSKEGSRVKPYYFCKSGKEYYIRYVTLK